MSKLAHSNDDEDWFNETAAQLVAVVRLQNWKNGGCLTVDVPEAIALVVANLKLSFTKGDHNGAMRYERMLNAVLVPK